jgi:hypothetical protein
MRKRVELVDVLIILLALLILLTLLAGALAIAFPEAARGVLTSIRSFTSSVFGGKFAKVVRSLSERAAEGYHQRIAPLFAKLARLFSGGKKPKAKLAKAKPAKPINFSGCTKCHQDLYEQAAFNHIYIDHRAHAAARVGCRRCHINAKHPKPATIKESSCKSCHRARKASLDCKACHAPGSLFNNKVIAKSKTEEFLASKTASTKILVPYGFEHPVGKRNWPCKQCHEFPDFCTGCHAGMKDQYTVGGPHDSKWIPTHGPRILRNEYTTVGCWNCHNSNLCASACHPHPGRRRYSEGWKLPKVELRH